jgi:ribonuclease G
VPTDILISSDPWENRVAIIEDGTLSEIYVEREEKVIGSIFKGKVQNVLPGMGASFVDIGLGRNAFLYVDDINKTPLNIGEVEITSGRSGWTITDKVNRGDDVLVQIVKEPRGLKGARISTNISLPGRYLILMPTGRYSGVSRKIESAEERNRLKGIMKAIRPEGMATVVRTAAAGVSSAELVADLGVLIRMWHGILEQYKRAESPALLHKDMNLVYKAARDFITPEVDNVYIDDPAEAENVRDFMRLLGPQYLDRIKPYERGRALFADFKVDDDLARLMRPTVKLPSGGSIVIETTEALTVIDVNSGKFTGGKNLEDTIVKTNVEAATEIARQVRLRDIGGIIVCDFIDMNSESARNKVIAALEGGLRKDRTRSTIQSFSALGLLEFTRKRVGKDLGQQLRGPCPTCNGLGSVMSPESVTISTFRRILTHANGHGEHVHIAASPNVAAQVEYWYEDELQELSKKIGKPIDVRVDAGAHPERPLVLWNGALPELPAIRVGDEFEVELLNVRTPNGTSALAVVNGRLVEVENAANQAGNTMKIKIIDVDGNEILAEPRIAIGAPPVAADGKRKRRRGGRGRNKPLTIEEQTDELLELAEEAARGLETRPAPVIGISTSEEAETEKADRSVKVATEAEARAKKGVIPTPKPAASVVGEGAVVRLPGESLSGNLVNAMPGETLSGARVGNVVPIAEASGSGDGTRRRRRRRRGGRGRDAEAGMEVTPLAPVANGVQHESDEDEETENDDAAPIGAAPAFGENGERKRRRRRRRGRGRGGAGASAAGTGTESAAVPDRHIFRVDSEGGAHPTGETAPREPSRAIAPLHRRGGAVAVEPPPPSLSMPERPTEEVKVTTPSRRRRGGSAPAAPPAPIAAAKLRALPPAEAEKPARRTRTAPAVEEATDAAATRRRVATRKTSVSPKLEAKVEKPVKRATTAGAKKVPAKKATTAKATTAKAATSAKKTATRKKATTAKKSTTTRKK